MMHRYITSLLLSLLGAGLTALHAGDSPAPYRPATNIFTVEAGGSQLADTYLTPLIYNGYSLALQYERWTPMRFNPRGWVMQLKTRAEWLHADSPARNNSMWYGGIDLRWAMMHRHRLPRSFTVGYGGATGIVAGCVYNGRNGNNPASAKASWTVDLTAYATWHKRFGRLPITFSYQATMPVVGAFFAPDYGELYYEIWLGNHKGLAHCAHWGNYFAMENAVMADLHFRGATLRVGYRSRALSTHINDVTTRIVSNAFVIGISGEWLSLSKARKIVASDPEVITALP